MNVVGHGGAREGAGRPAGPRTQEKADYDAWRARSERAKALKGELDLEIQRGQQVEREAVAAAAATVLATFTQHCRGIGGAIERALGLAPEVTERIEAMIDEALQVLAVDLQRLHEAGAAAAASHGKDELDE